MYGLKESIKRLILIFNIVIFLLLCNLLTTPTKSFAQGTADDIVNVAQQEIGYKAGYNNWTKYGEWYVKQNAPWCAMFVSWCAEQAGISEDVIVKHASCGVGVNWFKKQGRWEDRSNYVPKKGDIIYFGDHDHVGIVESVENNRVNTIEGNADNMVKRKSYALSSTYIMGYGIPDYMSTEASFVDLGTDFYAYIINTPAWKPLTNDSYNVSIREETGSANQVWKFDRDGDGAYKITNCQDGNVLDVHNFGTADGTNVSVAASNDSSAQRWYIYGESGAYYMKAKCSDLVLDIAGGSTGNGSNVQMWTKNDTPAQNFQIWKLNRPDASTIHCAPGTHYTPTSIWWTETNNTTSYNVKIWKDFVGNGEPYKCIFGLRDKSCTVELPEGNYEAYVDACNSFSFTQSQNTIKFNVQNGVPLDIGNDFYAAVLINKNWLNLTNVDGNVQLEAGDSGLSARQTWHFLRQSDGTYHILNCLDCKALDVYNFIDKEGTNVQVCDFNGSDAQKWYIYGRSSGEYYIQPKFANKVLDVCGGNNNPGDNIQIWTSNYTDAQKFAVYEINVAQNIHLDSKEKRLNIGESYQLIASLTPEDAVDKNLTWSSDHPETAEVDENGCVKAIGAGKAIITAVTITGEKAQCEIVVEKTTVKGDLNNDGRVDIMDARKAKRAAMKEISLTENELAAADINEDGKVDIMEARKIKRAAMKEIVL